MACCAMTKYVETLWEIAGAKRVRRLAEVVICSKHQQPIGELRKLNTGRWISDEEWARMRSYRNGQPPYCFEKRADGELYPEGYPPSPPPAAEPAS